MEHTDPLSVSPAPLCTLPVTFQIIVSKPPKVRFHRKFRKLYKVNLCENDWICNGMSRVEEGSSLIF